MLIEQLKELSVQDAEIGVITPYNAQVQQLRKRLGVITKAEISTVDGFQVNPKVME
jgi:superfamily I DNA and/or RNA helicase